MRLCQLQLCSKKRLLLRHGERVLKSTIYNTRTIDSTVTIRATLSKRWLSNNSRNSNAVYMAGNGWTGALGLGREGMMSPDTSHVSEEERDNTFVRVDIRQDEMDERKDISPPSNTIVNGAVGWGHSILHLCEEEIKKEEQKLVSDDGHFSSQQHYLLVAGRPFDFQTLLRINRLPPFAARFVVSNSLQLEEASMALYPQQDNETSESTPSAGFFMKLMDRFFRYNKEENDESSQMKANDAAIYRSGMYPSFSSFPLPKGVIPSSVLSSSHPPQHVTLTASAGVSAFISTQGIVYTLGLNQRGQCGIQDDKANFVWEWTPLVLSNIGKSVALTEREDEEVPNFVSVALGLQHGLALAENGQVYAWGKGTRGQLGLDVAGNDDEDDLRRIHDSQLDGNVKFHTQRNNDSSQSFPVKAPSSTSIDVEYAASPIPYLTNVTHISAGWNHSVAISNNRVLIWGKNVQLEEEDSNGSSGAIYEDSDNGDRDSSRPCDATHPILVSGLPPNLTIEQISCGSHHTSVLLQDGSIYAMGVATDNAQLISRFVQVLPPGHIDMSSLKQFKSHFDRTTIVFGHCGQKVLEFQLWSTPALREESVYEPAWVQDLIGGHDKEEDKEIDDGIDRTYEKSVQMVHRGWQHTLVVTRE